MSTQGSRDPRGDGAERPPAVPFSLARATRLSWELGTRVTAGDDAALRGAWECTAVSREIAVFDVTDHTAVIRVRTPVGRERFYGAADMDLEAALVRLTADSDWRRRQ
jgi:hypothetical protein